MSVFEERVDDEPRRQAALEARRILDDAIDGEMTACMNAPDMWFPPKGAGSTLETQMAKEACGACWVRNECLSYAIIADEESGIWGGVSFASRRWIRGQGRESDEARQARLVEAALKIGVDVAIA